MFNILEYRKEVKVKFEKYNSIENSYRKKEIDEIVAHGFDNLEWTVSEKVHGASFAIYCEDGQVFFGKRSGFLGENENFFNHNRLISEQKITEKVLAASINAKQIIFYGELCGGSYPHNNVRKYQVKNVQKKVYYHPDIVFVCFDIKVNGKFINDDERVYVCKKFEIPFLPILFRGSFQECLNYPNEFQTKVPELFDLPEIKNNICEGVVIKPLSPVYFKNGSRVILKNKNSKFTEKEKNSSIPKIEQFSEELTGLIEEYCEYITENRLRAVISKICEITQKDFGKIIKEFNDDTMKDFLKDNEKVFNSLIKEDQKKVTKIGNKVASKMIRDNFANIIDGNF